MDKIKVLYTEEEISKRVKELAETLYNTYKDEEVVFVCTLKGAVFFACDILKRYNGDARLEFLRVSSYEGESSTGKISLKMPLDAEKINGKHVVIVEDIVDTGFTMKRMVESLGTRHPESIHICSLLVKPGKLQVPLKIEYAAMEIPNDFILGYGLDYDQQGRQLKDIYVLDED